MRIITLTPLSTAGVHSLRTAQHIRPTPHASGIAFPYAAVFIVLVLLFVFLHHVEAANASRTTPGLYQTGLISPLRATAIFHHHPPPPSPPAIITTTATTTHSPQEDFPRAVTAATGERQRGFFFPGNVDMALARCACGACIR
ncbi:hypothetical protein LIA77_09496 [Sarocladium implicatum]|nr:hypothetical protein LIA77_09496 [Sarocladium implicatum]